MQINSMFSPNVLSKPQTSTVSTGNTGNAGSSSAAPATASGIPGTPQVENMDQLVQLLFSLITMLQKLTGSSSSVSAAQPGQSPASTPSSQPETDTSTSKASDDSASAGSSAPVASATKTCNKKDSSSAKDVNSAGNDGAQNSGDATQNASSGDTQTSSDVTKNADDATKPHTHSASCGCDSTKSNSQTPTPSPTPPPAPAPADKAPMTVEEAMALKVPDTIKQDGRTYSLKYRPGIRSSKPGQPGFVPRSPDENNDPTLKYFNEKHDAATSEDEKGKIIIAKNRYQASKGMKITSPLVFDLNGDGVKTSTDKTRFDINGDGQKDTVNDISKGDGLLVFDADGNGVSGESNREAFGDVTDLSRFGIQSKSADGFETLRILADQAKGKGLINQDDVLDKNELKALEQEYGLKMKKGGLNSDASSLAEAGIESINLSNGKKTFSGDFDNQGNALLEQEGASFKRTDGSDSTYSDVFFREH